MNSSVKIIQGKRKLRRYKYIKQNRSFELK